MSRVLTLIAAQHEVLVRAERRRPWTPDQKRQIVAESLEPGVRPAEVARRHEIGRGQLYTWRRQMIGAQSVVLRQSAPRFAPVELSSSPAPQSSPPDPAPMTAVSDAAPPPPRAEGLIEIMLRNGVSLRVDAHVDGRALRRVLAALEDR